MALTRDVAETMAFIDCNTVEPAVIELHLLAYNSPSRETRYRALKALEWFSLQAIEEPERPAVPEERSDVDAAIESLRWVIYGWTRKARARAARHCGEVIEHLAGRAS